MTPELRAEDGLRQIEDIVGRCVSNPGLESNVVEMVGKLADKYDALKADNAKLRQLVEECRPYVLASDEEGAAQLYTRLIFNGPL